MTGDERTITIRNIDKETYDKLMAVARELGMKSGEIVNQALRAFLATVEYGITVPIEATREAGKRFLSKLAELKEAVIISDLDKLEVSAKDLSEVEGKVVFRNIKELRLGDDVTPELFRSKVMGIALVDRLVVPKGLPKLLVLQRAKFVREVVKEE